jgi:hypothetical protein
MAKVDEVYIVSSTTTPFVLRKYGESGHKTGKRLIVGNCYAHALMNGEGVSMQQHRMSSFLEFPFPCFPRTTYIISKTLYTLGEGIIRGQIFFFSMSYYIVAQLNMKIVDLLPIF